MRSWHADNEMRFGFALPKMLMIMSKVMMLCSLTPHYVVLSPLMEPIVYYGE